MEIKEQILRSEFYGNEWDELMDSLGTDITPSILSAMKKYAIIEVDNYIKSSIGKSVKNSFNKIINNANEK